MQTLPGTNKEFKNEDAFLEFKKMIELTDGISLSQVCSITSLDTFTIQNWVKRGYVAKPIKKKYYAKQLARILMINAIRASMQLDEVGELMKLINGDVEDESDDLISEENLYILFSKVVYHLKDVNQIDETIKSILKKEKYKNKKLEIALKIMIHGYIASENIKTLNDNFNLLRQN